MIATAVELFEARHYPGVVAMTSDALEDEPECVPLLLIRARAHIALRRSLDAQADLRDIIRLDPRCGSAFRLLGELAARRNENQSAAIFFREALRLDPGDQGAADWLHIVDAAARPAAVVTTIPAPTTAAGHLSPNRDSLDRAPIEPARRPTEQPQTLGAGSTRTSQPRFAKGTASPEEFDRPTRPFARAAEPDKNDHDLDTVSPLARPPKPSAPAWAVARMISLPVESPPARGSSAPVHAKPAPYVQPRPISRGPIPELPGFGDYLVAAGILTRERLRAAQAYQRSMKVQLATAIVTLGLATPQRIEWAAVAHQSELARARL